jgi:hypothetical protein
MSRTLSRFLIALAATAVAAALAFVVAPGADAQRHHKTRFADRNHDRIPDTWERRYRLSLRVNQARRDQDHDGLNNRQEFIAGDNPRKADSNHDGTDDSQEGAGTVTSFAGGKLTITLFNGDVVTATLNDQTELKCQPSPMATTGSTARAADDGPGNDDQGDDDNENEQGDDDDQGAQQPGCDTSLLTAGRGVNEAEAKATAAGLVWEEVKIVR